MANKRKFYYVGVGTSDGMTFVTKTLENRTCVWNPNEKPKAFPASVARDIAEGLCFNLIFAVVVESFLVKGDGA